MAAFKMCAKCQAEYDDLGEPAVPRPAERLLATAARSCHATSRGAGLLAEAADALTAVAETLCTGPDCRGKGHRGLSPRLRCDQSQRQWPSCDGARYETTSRSPSWWRWTLEMRKIACACSTQPPSPTLARSGAPSCWPAEDRAERGRAGRRTGNARPWADAPLHAPAPPAHGQGCRPLV